MATNITFRPGIEGLMAALAAAEELSSTSPIVPSHVKIDIHSEWHTGYADPVGVHLYFHRDLDAVRVFADRHGLTVRQERDGSDELTSTGGVINGVPFRVWTLTDVESPAVAA